MLALKVLLFTVVVPGTVTVYLPLLLHRRLGGFGAFDLPAAVGALAIPVGLFGLALYARSAWDFAVAGRGTPAPIDPPKELVVRGLYRWTRNPMYVGVLSILLAEALFLGTPLSLGYAVAVFCFFQSFIVLYEEPTLARQFGDSYRRYRDNVPRWLSLLPLRSRH